MRREVTLTVICALLVACSAAASAPDESHDPIVQGVGVLPVSNPVEEVAATEVETVPPSEPTTTLTPVQTIGTLSKGQRKRALLGIGLLTPQPALLIDEPGAPWSLVVEVHPTRVTIAQRQGWGAAETIDLE